MIGINIPEPTFLIQRAFGTACNVTIKHRSWLDKKEYLSTRARELSPYSYLQAFHVQYKYARANFFLLRHVLVQPDMLHLYTNLG